jgi:hypothetical protein
MDRHDRVERLHGPDRLAAARQANVATIMDVASALVHRETLGPTYQVFIFGGG